VTERHVNVLFLCTGNSARSIIAEAILRQDGAGGFGAFSAGSEPKGRVNPLALEVLKSAGYPTGGLRSKRWDEFAGPGAPAMDLVLTVCDNAAGESCPIWPGHPVTAHWGIEDPAAVEGTEADRKAAFRRAFACLKARVDRLCALPLRDLDNATLRSRLRAIGQEDGASRAAAETPSPTCTIKKRP
jgi:arsenate reductase